VRREFKDPLGTTITNFDDDYFVMIDTARNSKTHDDSLQWQVCDHDHDHDHAMPSSTSNKDPDFRRLGDHAMLISSSNNQRSRL
jgi:hypothetical protein